MRNVLILVFLCVSLSMTGTTYYLDPSGSDSNNGSSSSPWKTLAYACSKVTASGDIIHVNAGTFTETSQSVLAVGVSVEGAGRTNTFIVSNITNSYAGTLYLASGTENTNGNQHISGIYFDGNNQTTYCAMWVSARSNVEIYNCTFINYAKYGLRFHGNINGGSPSTSVNYSTNNSVHDCIITNCAYYQHGIGGGADIYMDCQTGFLCYNNTITQSRTTYQNGCGVKTNGWTKGLKIYNNTITCDINSNKEVTDSWDFAIECWGDIGSISEGIEIYGNTLYNGEIDIAGRITQKGSYDYGCSIHDNYIGGSSFPTVMKIGIILEANTSLSDILIFKNHFKWVTEAIVNYCTVGSVSFNNISIYYNLFEEIGQNVDGSSQGRAIWSRGVSGGTGFKVNNLHIYNNVIAATTRANSTQAVGIQLENQSTNTYSNIEVKNNIITGFDLGPFYNGTTGAIDYLWIQNNIFYGNGNNNAPVLNTTPTHYSNGGNLTSNPLFVSSADFHLKTLSPAIGKGLSVSGLAADYDGNAIKSPPSIGAYESGSTASTPPPAVPVYQSSAVANATPSLLEMTYNITLANIVPVASAFLVKVNSLARPVSSVVISGTKVQLTLASPVVTGDVITVSYTIPASNPVQTTSGGQAATIIAQTVTNNVNAVNPIYISSAVANATPTILEITYNMTLANIVPSISAYTVLVNSVARTVNSVSVSGVKVNLTLVNRIVTGDVVTVSYTKPAITPIQTTSNGIAASISNQQVINNCINTAPTAVITSPLTNSSFSASASITITASALDTDGSVTLVEFYNGSTKLGSKSSAPYIFTWNNVTAGNYSLTVTATDNLNTKITSSSISISVVNAAPKPNQHPIVKILNPSKGIKFDKLSAITIDAIASDPDGSVSKVEFYSGSVKLVELTSAPYTYTWKDVVAGNYSITAVATDNLNDTTISSPVEFEIGSTVKYDVNSEIVKLYPNPNNGHFSVEFIKPLQNDKSEIIITDLAGKQIYNGPVLKEETLKQIDVSGSRSGIYVVMIKDKEILVTKKFMKN